MKPSLTVTIRPLCLDCLEETVEVHIAAFPGYLNTKIGRAYLRKFFVWFITSENAIALSANDQTGKVVGYVIGAFNYGRALQKYLMLTAILGILTHFWVLIDIQFVKKVLNRFGLRKKTNSVAPLLPPLPRPINSLVGIGVSPEFRGCGVGEMLIKEFEKASITSGLQSICLSVYPNNFAARKLYEKAGWQPGLEPEDPNDAMYYTKLIS